MKVVCIKGKVLKLYDSIDEMPIVNFQKYNKYLLIDAGLGSDADDVDAHIVRIAKFIKAKNEKEALQELQNMRQNLHMINSNISPKYLAFAALIHSINGKELTDLSDDNLQSVLSSLKDTPHSFITRILALFKKKVQSELETYFPVAFSVSAKDKDLYDKLKARTLLVLGDIIDGTNSYESIADIDRLILAMCKPKLFYGPESIEVKHERDFNNACLLIAKELNYDTNNLTVLQFYNALELIKKQTEAKSKALNNNSHGRR